MNIKEKHSVYIAIYLMKGAFENKYHDTCLQICENGEIGIAKKGLSKYSLYVKKDGKIEKKRNNPLFDSTISVDVLSDYIQQLINESTVLKDCELNLSKIPEPSLMNIPPKSELIMAQSVDGTSLKLAETDIPTTPTESVQDEKITDADNDFDDLSLLDDMIDDEILAAGMEVHPEKLDDDDDLEFERCDTPVMESKKTIIENDTTPVDVIEEEQSVEEMTSIIKTVPNNEEKHQLTVSNIALNSYLNILMSNDIDMTERQRNVFEKLAEFSTEEATEIYISSLCTLLPHYSFDFTRMAEELHVDRRDIVLAALEKKLI